MTQVLGSVFGPGAGAPPLPERTATVGDPPGRPPAEVTAAGTAPPAAADTVQLSAAALAYDARTARAEAEQRRIGELRAQIANGTYLTEEKLEVAIERLFEDLRTRL